MNWTSPHPDGVAGSSLNPEAPSAEEDHSLYVLLLDDGTIKLASGTGTRPYGIDPSAEEVVYPGHVLELVHSSLEVAAHLATVYLGYEGPWRAGIFLDRLRGRRSSSALSLGSFGGPRFPTQEYLRTVDTTTEQMRANPAEVVARLVGPLLRGLGDDHFLPYTHPTEIVDRVRRG